jgi:hypothetical protein
MGCTDAEFLDTGGSLKVLLEPGIAVAAPGPGDGTCTEASGVGVRIVASHADGAAASKAHVQLWLTGTVAATLSETAVVLGDDGTSNTACLSPGTSPGTATVHARSGPIEATASLDIRARAVPAGGSLIVATTPVASTQPVPASACGGAMPGACTPGEAREAAITISAQGTETQAVPEGAVVTLTTDLGWLSATSCDASGPREPTLAVALARGIGHAIACFPDLGGTATITARSGPVLGSGRIEVPSIPRVVHLVANRSHAAAGEDVAFHALVSDCQGRGIANVPVGFAVTAGQLTLADGASFFGVSGADGTVTLRGAAATVPLGVSIRLLGAPQVQCAASIAGGGTP